MINFAVINLKSIIKNFIKFSIIVFLIIGIMNIQDLITHSTNSISYADIIRDNISIPMQETQKELGLKKIINSEFPILASSTSTQISNEEENSVDNLTQNLTTDTIVPNDTSSTTPETTQTVAPTIPENVTTSVVAENNLPESYNTTYGNVKIKNETSFNLDNETLIPNIGYSNTKDIVIFHTHTCESYTQTEQNSYTPSGNFRTIDTNHSVAQVRKCINF